MYDCNEHDIPCPIRPLHVCHEDIWPILRK
jgi:hypothetical protein